MRLSKGTALLLTNTDAELVKPISHDGSHSEEVVGGSKAASGEVSLGSWC